MAGFSLPVTVDPPCSFYRRWSTRLRRHVIEPIIIFIISVSLWGLYRYILINYTDSFGSNLFFIGQIIMMPLIWLGPAVVYWYILRRGQGLFFTITRERAFQVTLVALVIVTIYYIIFDRLTYLGYSAADLALTDGAYVNIWKSLGADGFVLTTFTFFFIVGPVEEMLNRGFLLGQFAKALPPWMAVLLSAFLFAAGHWPINYLFYGMGPGLIAIMTFYYMGFGVFMGMFYLWSRNLLGAIVLHGFWDWILSVYAYYYVEDPTGSAAASIAILVVVEWVLVLIFLFFMFQLYKRWWKQEWQDDRWGVMNDSAPRPRLYAHLSETGNPWNDRRVRGEVLAYYSRNHAITEKGKKWDLKGRRMGFGTSTFAVVVVITLFCATSMGVTAGAMSQEEYLVKVAGMELGGVQQQYNWGEQESGSFSETHDDAAENTDVNVTIPLEAGVRLNSITIEVEWTDESNRGPRYENQPDYVGMTVRFPDGSNETVQPRDTGSISVSWKSGQDETYVIEEPLQVTVKVGECGNQEPILGLFVFTDSNTDFVLTADYYFQQDTYSREG